MNILLTTLNSKYIHQNLAIRILYALNKHHKNLSVYEFGNKISTEEIAEYCLSFEIIAFSCYIWNIAKTLETARQIKNRNPDCKILVGGPEVSFEWEPVITLPYVDFIIRDEGEIPFSSFIQYYPNFLKVPGLIWKQNNKVIVNELPEMLDLNSLANINPYENIPADELQNKIIYIEASRGCPSCCGFCLAGLQNRIRHFPLETLFENLKFVMEKGRVIKFLDRTFNANPKYALSIFRFILQNYQPGNIFQFEIKADILQPELTEFVKTNVPKGLFRFEIGIQTLNSTSNMEVKRKQNFENIKTFIAEVSDKVEIHLDLIVGLPHDYFNDIRFSFDEVFKLFAPELQLGFLKFLKGTPMRENYLEHDYIFKPLPPYQIRESKYLSAGELELINLVEHTLDIYWNKKRAVYTLKYIASIGSVFDFLLGFGKYLKEKELLRFNGLIELYTALYEFTNKEYPNSTILCEFITLDYYLQHKVKPATRFLPELSKEKRQVIIENQKLNLHKYRYAIHPVHFNVSKFMEEGNITETKDILIIEFSGVNNPGIINFTS